MSDKTHGHAPRVRHRKNGEKETVLQINKDKVLSTITSSAIGAVIGTIVTNAIDEDS